MNLYLAFVGNVQKFGDEARYCGSAMTVVFTSPQKLAVANSGDCGAFMGLSNKRNVLLTSTHRVEGYGRDIE